MLNQIRQLYPRNLVKLKKITKHQRLGASDAWHVIRNFINMKMKMNIKQIRMIKNLGILQLRQEIKYNFLLNSYISAPKMLSLNNIELKILLIFQRIQRKSLSKRISSSRWILITGSWKVTSLTLLMEVTRGMSKKTLEYSMEEASLSTRRMIVCTRDGGSGIRGRYMGDSLTKMGSYMKASSRTICRTAEEKSSRAIS